MALDLTQIKALLEDRPYKYTEEQVNYRPSTGKERCGPCYHHYLRAADGFGVCELVRSERIDREGIDPEYVCDWFSEDGEEYPLAKDTRETGETGS